MIKKEKRIAELEKAIKEVEKTYDTEYPLDDFETIDWITHQLEDEGVISFSVCFRANAEMNDVWLQCEYWSKNLNHTIISYYNWSYSFKNTTEFAEALYASEEKHREIEKQIIPNKGRPTTQPK
jgi:hypothetical protein